MSKKRVRETAWLDELKTIIADYKEGSGGDPLDGDSVDHLVELIRNRINLHEGNITDREFEKLEEKI